MKKIGVVFCALAVSAALALTGCTVATDNAPRNPPAPAGSSAAHGAAKNPYADKIKIAFLPDQIGDSVGGAWGDGIQKELAVFPNVTFQRFDGKLSAETQVQIMSDLINQKFDGIILQAHDSAALASSVAQAEKAGIPVITLNLDATTPHTGLVAMVDQEAGALIAQQIAKETNEAGNVVIIQASPGASRGELLEAGFRTELKKYPNMKILDAQTGEWLTEKANVVMNDFLTKYPKIDAVFAHNDAMAEGASQAAEAAGRLKNMVIWGADGESKALQYIEQGKMTGTIYTNCYDQGATAARLAMWAIGSGINFSSLDHTPIIKMAPIVATKETVGSIGQNIRW